METDSTDGFFAGKAVAEFNPDAGVAGGTGAQPLIPSGRGVLARVPFDFPPRFERAVAVGSDAVVFRNGGCADCFELNAKALELRPPSVALQALAALAWQRIVLGHADALGAVRLSGEPSPLLRCGAHR